MDKEIVLLTGYAGFIGSQLLRDLISSGYYVVGLDNFSEGSNPENIRGLEGEGTLFTLLKMDMGDCSLEDTLMDLGLAYKLKYIINCGAQSHVDRSFSQVRKFVESNIIGPLNLAKMALNEKWKVEKFIQVSTDEVFAHSPQPFHENSPYSPQNAYATSKHSAEVFLQNYHKAFGLPLVITNGANTYGPRQNEEKIIPLTIKRIIERKKIPLYKTPARRMWMHVEDHSSGIIAAMENGIIGEKYCLAPNDVNEKYTSELIEDICELMGVNFEDFVEYVEDRPNYDLRYYMVNDKAVNELGWVPQKDINNCLKDVISTYTSW